MSSLGNKFVMAKNLKYFIDRSGKSRRELAQIWGFPYSTLSEWLNAKKYPRIDRIEKMASYFGILKSDLIEDNLSEQKKIMLTNDILADIIIKMRSNTKFLDAVKALFALDDERIDKATQILKLL